MKTVFITLSTQKQKVNLVKLSLRWWLCNFFRGKHNAAVGNCVYFSLQWQLKSLENVELFKKCDLVKDVYYVIHISQQPSKMYQYWLTEAKILMFRSQKEYKFWNKYIFVNERCEKWTKAFTTLLFITLSFITLNVFHLHIQV